ncbi:MULTISPECIES: glycosyl hydrolase family 28-related protein [Mammaliicoccus]|uniref:Pectate lyase n=1 Tax=Mammaliicoccus lentus TaxID=42858 RepID=A0ABS6GZH1_MAMLE|nr:MULTISPECIES: glycosyl hydrolase family 28-related protein [Mammaliicoccus]MBF0749481.1 pectate lyase [Mammaliicoccus lentus]MBF0794723.1 pectate lyase [Mammaliicoccus lentus]MBU6113751.1 pectate lyase [Mammaliicoccus lentus]MEB5686132.1 pectate lyase [Mammaliicoccus lentus]TFU57608.1 pectate lyase [Mammaliicoccus lentus]
MTRIINVANYGAKGKSGVLDTLGIQLALFEARKGPVTVYIPKGEYHILYELVIYRNTNLILHDDATIIRKSPSAMLKNGHSFKKYYGYEGHGNINIIGGTFDAYGHTNNTNNTIMSIGHAKNIQIHDVTFKNVVGGHAIDACGLDGFYVTNSHFLGFRDDSGTRSFSEAIQIDIQTEGAFPKFGATDGTVTKNVIIENCYFGNSGDMNMSAWNRAIGSHASMYDCFYENIHIQNNRFDGLGDYAVTMLKSKETTITNNYFVNCEGGIRYLAVPTGKYSMDINKVDKGAQSGSTLLIGNNKFENIKSKQSILIKSYEKSINKDIYIYDNKFIDKISDKIQFINASDIYLSNNFNLSQIKQKNVERLNEIIKGTENK